MRNEIVEKSGDICLLEAPLVLIYQFFQTFEGDDTILSPFEDERIQADAPAASDKASEVTSEDPKLTQEDPLISREDLKGSTGYMHERIHRWPKRI